MKCPSCSDSGAYVGFSTVACPNIECIHFSEEQLNQVVALAEEEFKSIDLGSYMDDRDMEDLYSGIMTQLGFEFED